jgi:hypothetical protein
MTTKHDTRGVTTGTSKEKNLKGHITVLLKHENQLILQHTFSFHIVTVWTVWT